MATPEKPQSSPGSGTHAASPAAATAGDERHQVVPVERDAEQLALDDMLPLAVPMSAPRGAGRPKGAKNIRQERTARMLIARYGDPLAADMALGTMETKALYRALRELATELGCRLGDVTVMGLLSFQAARRDAIMNYVHGKRAPTDDRGVPVVPVIGIGSVNVQVNGAPAGGSGRSLEDVVDAEATEIPTEQYQGVSDDADE